MNSQPNMAALALPQLARTIPSHYTVPGADALAVPLTIALLEAGVISDAILRAPRNALTETVEGENEKQLSARALSHWWTRLIRERPCKFFRWHLHVQQLNVEHYGDAKTAWFCFTRIEGNIPRFALAVGIERLEKMRRGFGQTVLAVLRDAALLIPESFNPWQARDWVERAWWQDTRDDVELLELQRENHGFTTVQELVDNVQVITRARFYENMPEWVCDPKRILPREAIGAAATNEFARRVVAICDALHALVHQDSFRLQRSDAGTYRCGYDTIDASMILLWRQFDVIGEAIDEYLNDLGACGEYSEFIDANQVQMTADGIREFMTLTEQKIQVAVLVEQLVLLLGEQF